MKRLAAAAALVAALTISVPAQATTRLAKPAGGVASGDCTTVATACTLAYAVGSGSQAGDTITLLRGASDYTTSGITLSKTLTVQGESGDPRPVVKNPSVSSVFTIDTNGNGSSISHLDIQTPGVPVQASAPFSVSDDAVTGGVLCVSFTNGGSVTDSTLHQTGTPSQPCLLAKNINTTPLADTTIANVTVTTDVATAQPAVVVDIPSATVTDVSIDSQGPALVAGVPTPTAVPTGATIHRLSATSATGTGATLSAGSVMTDSLVRAAGGTAVEMTAGTLRNVTAVSQMGGAGLDVLTGAPAQPASAVSVLNSILNGNTSDVIHEPSTTSCGGACQRAANLTIGHSDYSTLNDGAPGAFTNAGGNVSGAPKFVSATDLHEKLGTPTIDSGVDDPANGATDLDGNPRKQGSAVDMGAYETKRLDTSVALASSASPAARDALPTLTATVSQGSAGDVPTGTVTFTDGGTTLGSSPVGPDGAATLTPDLPVGAHDVKASYGGDLEYNPASSDSLSQQMTRERTKTTIDPTWSDVTVTSLGPGALKPTGFVTVTDNDAPLGTFPLDGNGNAAIDTGTLAKGVHVLVVSYSGDSNFDGSAAGKAITVVEAMPGGQGETVTALSLAGPSTFSAKADKKGGFSLKGLTATCGSSACTFTATESKKLARGTLALTAGKSGTPKLKLTAAGKKQLKRKKKLTLTVKVSGRDATGKTVTKTVKVKLK